MVKPLQKLGKIKRKGPVVLLIMDGVGFGKYKEGDAVAAAVTQTLDRLYRENPWTKLKAHGTAVGLPSDDDMGNSEVGQCDGVRKSLQPGGEAGRQLDRNQSDV